MHAPLLVTCDTDLLDDQLRLAAAAGVTLDVAHDPASALRLWPTAPLVLVGHDLAPAVAAQRPPRRPDVFVLTSGEPDYRSAVSLGATDVVALPAGEAWLVEALADVGDGGVHAATTIGVVGGSGGVGATTLACAVALAAHRPAALIDLDPLGPGVEHVVGVGGGLGWGDFAGSHGRLSSRALREALPQRDGVAVLGWGATAGDLPDETVVREVLAAAGRGHDLVVIDLPRNTSQLSSQVASRCDAVVLVGACSLLGAASAARALATVAPSPTSVHLVARASTSAVTPAALAGALGLPLLATLGDERRLPEQVELGLGPLHGRRGHLARAARQILEELT